MMGREAYSNPYLLASVDQQFYGLSDTGIERDEVVKQLLPYIQDHLDEGGRLNHITRHITGLYQGMPGAKIWRRTLSEQAHISGAGTEVVENALAKVQVERQRMLQRKAELEQNG
jgi:tRNA-dihydrouridine synthase A